MEAKWIVVFLISPFVGLLTLATVVKFIEVRRARTWILTQGRVVRSATVQRPVERPQRGAHRQIRNFASVAYEFNVGGRKFTGTRVGISEDMGNIGVRETLARYPVGKQVDVYYDPANPARAVLEREIPKDGFVFMGLLIAALTLCGVVIATGTDKLAVGLRALLPNLAATPFVVAFTLFALFLLLMARLAAQESKSVAKWIPTTGKILESSFDTFRTQTSFDRIPVSIIVHRPRIVYSYKVGGSRYQSERIALGVYKHASLKFLVGQDVIRYKAGDTVPVYYDPANPAQAVLRRADVRPPIFIVLAAFFAAAAIWVSVAV